jgi:hypothetical protein
MLPLLSVKTEHSGVCFDSYSFIAAVHPLVYMTRFKDFSFAIIALIPSLIWYSPPFLMLLSKTF